MAFTLKTTMNVVLQESPAPALPGMLLPWEKKLSDDAATARMGGGIVQPQSQDYKVTFPGITTLTTLWFYPEAPMAVKLGGGSPAALQVQAGGCVGFTHASVPADEALRVTYDGTEPAGFFVVWGGS